MKKNIFLSLLSSLILILSFPNFNLWILAWFGFVPLFFAIQNKSKWKVFFLSYLTGIIFWWGIIYWLIHVTLAGLIILVLYLAIYFGIFGLIVSTIDHRPSTITLLFVPSIWVLLEYIRAYLFTGFGWALLGYSQYLNLSIIQIADITGAWGVSFLVMMVNVVIYKVISYKLLVMGERKKISLPKIYYVLPFLLLLLSLGYGFYKLNSSLTTHSSSPIRVSVIQGNILQELKWQAHSQEFILNKHIELSKEASLDNPDLIIWPEAATPGFLFNWQDRWIFQNLFNLAKELKTNLLVGSVVKDNSGYFNSALLIDREGKIIQRYDKLHLVPFGEYIPLKKILGFLETVVPMGDFVPGREYTIFSLDTKTKFSVLICFEDLFPELSRRFVKKGAYLLVNITNDAWYKKTSAASQHFQASVFRAVENRVFLVRSANTGVSGFIRPDGQIISLVQDAGGADIFIDGHRTEEFAIIKRGLTFYTAYGDIFVLACLILIIYGIIIRYISTLQRKHSVFLKTSK